MTRWAGALDNGQWPLDIITSSFCQVYQQGGDLFVPPNYSPNSIRLNHLDQMRYLLSKPPCWTPFSACPRVVTGQLLAWGKKRAPSHLWVGPCGVSLRACHPCHPLRQDQPGGCSNRLILYNIRVKPWCSRPRTIWARWRRSNTKYPWSLSLCLIENVVKKNPNGHSTSSILHSGGDGRGGYAGKEVLKSNSCTDIFHKQSVVCTLNCMLKFSSVFDGATFSDKDVTEIEAWSSPKPCLPTLPNWIDFRCPNEKHITHRRWSWIFICKTFKL